MLKESYFGANPTHDIMITELVAGTDENDDDDYATGSAD